MSKDHAFLAPSAASRWMACTKSAKLESDFKSTTSTYADEGTLAHTLAEVTLKFRLKTVTKQWYKSRLLDLKKSEYYNEAMEEYVEEYVNFVLETFHAHAEPSMIFIEDKMDMSTYIPEGFGTEDTVIVAPKVVELVDLKYGKGILVSAVNNKQMMVYGLAVLEKYGFIHDIEKVIMTIHQPRLNNYSSFEMSARDLFQWGQDELIPKAKLAYEGKGTYVAGEHCGFCKAKAICRVNSEYQLELTKLDFKKPDLLDDSEILKVLEKAKLFVDWVNSVSQYALAEAVENNKKWEGFKLVAGRSNRKYMNEETIAGVLKEKGYSEDEIFTKKLINITAMQAHLGAITFDELLSSYLIKPAGAPTLVPKTDKRPELNSAESAKIDFQ